jgi:hypothetical protein
MRDPEKEALWRARIDEWKSSPETVSEFCKARGINEHNFRSWQQVVSNRDAEARQNGRVRPGRRRSTSAPQPEKVEFAPVTLVEHRPEAFANEVKFAEHRGGSIEIVTPRGYVVRLPVSIDAAVLQLVFSAINQAC